MNRIATGDINCIAVVKGNERYVFMWDAASSEERSVVLMTLGKFASNPELSFTLEDADDACRKLRAMEREQSA